MTAGSDFSLTFSWPKSLQADDSYQYAPVGLDDSALTASGPQAYGPPAAAPHAGPDHVDYGAYTGGYGAFGWYTDHPVLLGPGHRRRRQALWLLLSLLGPIIEVRFLSIFCISNKTAKVHFSLFSKPLDVLLLVTSARLYPLNISPEPC